MAKFISKDTCIIPTNDPKHYVAWADNGAKIKNPPVTVYKRNGLQDQIFSEEGVQRYVCMMPKGGHNKMSCCNKGHNKPTTQKCPPKPLLQCCDKNKHGQVKEECRCPRKFSNQNILWADTGEKKINYLKDCPTFFELIILLQSQVNDLPLTAYRRNGIQDQVFTKLGAIRYLCLKNDQKKSKNIPKKCCDSKIKNKGCCN